MKICGMVQEETGLLGQNVVGYWPKRRELSHFFVLWCTPSHLRQHQSQPNGEEGKKVLQGKTMLNIWRSMGSQESKQKSVHGLSVHPWLAASPDAQVNDPDVPSPHGIVEIKCPFSKADVTVEVSCRDTLFYCTTDREKNLKLAQNHQYYHQVQLQLYTSGASWCDFCVYTTKDTLVGYNIG